MVRQVIPYLASAQWYAVWLSFLLKGEPNQVAVSLANAKLALSGKGFNRSFVPTPDGSSLLLSVPVVGGASAIKRGPTESLVVSDHGDWPRTHLGAFEAAFGRSPFYRELEPALTSIISSAPGRLLSDLNTDLHRLQCQMLNIPALISPLRNATPAQLSRYNKIAKELSLFLKINNSLSLLNLLATQGPDAIFSLLANA